MLSGDQAADMIRVAAQKPMERSAAIKQWRNKLDFNNQPKLKEWGLEVHKDMMDVDARVLQAPKVTYKNNKQLNCQFGGWNLKGVSFTRPGAPLKSWAVVSFDYRFRRQDMQRFVGFFIQQMKTYGINIQNNQPALLEAEFGNNNEGILSGIQNACREAYMQSKANPQIVLCLIPVSMRRKSST